jgi:hypothetical protein
MLLQHGGWVAPPTSISTLRGQFGTRGQPRVFRENCGGVIELVLPERPTIQGLNMGALNAASAKMASGVADSALDPGNLFERGDVEVACAHLTVSQYGVSDSWYAIFMYCIPFLVLVRYPCWNSQGLKQEFFPAASRRYRCRRLPRSETIQSSARGGLRGCPSIDCRVETRAKISDAVERDHAPISAPRNWT